MVIGCLVLDIFLPYAASLKDKRKVLNHLRDRIRSRHNVALAELEYQDKWQLARIGIVTLNSEQAIVDQVLHRIADDIRDNLNGEILKTDFLHF